MSMRPAVGSGRGGSRQQQRGRVPKLPLQLALLLLLLLPTTLASAFNFQQGHSSSDLNPPSGDDTSPAPAAWNCSETKRTTTCYIQGYEYVFSKDTWAPGSPNPVVIIGHGQEDLVTLDPKHAVTLSAACTLQSLTLVNVTLTSLQPVWAQGNLSTLNLNLQGIVLNGAQLTLRDVLIRLDARKCSDWEALRASICNENEQGMLFPGEARVEGDLIQVADTGTFVSGIRWINVLIQAPPSCPTTKRGAGDGSGGGKACASLALSDPEFSAGSGQALTSTLLRLEKTTDVVTLLLTNSILWGAGSANSSDLTINNNVTIIGRCVMVAMLVGNRRL